MADIVLVRNKEEARVFADKFQQDIGLVIRTRTVDGVSCGLNEQMIMHKVLLWNAGYMEALRTSGLEIVRNMGKLPPTYEYLLERESPEDIYEFYTDGFNFGIQTSDEHQADSTERIGRMFASLEGAAAGTAAVVTKGVAINSVGEHAHQEDKKEEVK
jgi:hypothetical protein